MALTLYYIIQDATNAQYYTKDNSTDLSNRWSNSLTSAYPYVTRAAAETELDVDTFSSVEFRIIEVIIKS